MSCTTVPDLNLCEGAGRHLALLDTHTREECPVANPGPRHRDDTRQVDAPTAVRSCRSCTNGWSRDSNGRLWSCTHPATHRLALVCFTCAAGVEWAEAPNGTLDWVHTHAEPRNHHAVPVPAGWYFRWTHQRTQARLQPGHRVMPRPGQVLRELEEEARRAFGRWRA